MNLVDKTNDKKRPFGRFLYYVQNDFLGYIMIALFQGAGR